jgi:hypothetical protein
VAAADEIEFSRQHLDRCLEASDAGPSSDREGETFLPAEPNDGPASMNFFRKPPKNFFRKHSSDLRDRISGEPDRQTAAETGPATKNFFRKHSSDVTDRISGEPTAAPEPLDCPICGRPFPEALINGHVDECLNSETLSGLRHQDRKRKSPDHPANPVTAKKLKSLKEARTIRSFFQPKDG